jgi:hypothetical protein
VSVGGDNGSKPIFNEIAVTDRLIGHLENVITPL